MRYHGRSIDPIRLWDRYVELPAHVDEREMFLPKVVCPNPDHDTFKRHFQINVRDGLVHCFAYCGISGSYEHAICVIEGLYAKYKVEEAGDKGEQKRRADRARREARKLIFREVTTKRQRIPEPLVSSRRGHRADEIVHDDSVLEYSQYLPQSAQEFLGKRGVDESSVSKWRLGWDATEARLVIPAYDERDVLRFLIKRAVRPKDQPKYLYTEGYPKNSLLFGACAIPPGMIKSDGLILVEGSLDTILNHQNGLENTAAILGTGISISQAEIISRMRPKRIYLMFDKDIAGITNIEIACKRLRRYPLYVVRLPKGKLDPGELTAKEANRSIERAIPAIKWITENYPNATRQKGAYVGH